MDMAKPWQLPLILISWGDVFPGAGWGPDLPGAGRCEGRGSCLQQGPRWKEKGPDGKMPSLPDLRGRWETMEGAPSRQVAEKVLGWRHRNRLRSGEVE